MYDSLFCFLNTNNVILGIFANMKSTEHNLPVTIHQILSWVKQCSTQERKMLLMELLGEKQQLKMASEKSLAKDWLSKEEEEAWKNL